MLYLKQSTAVTLKIGPFIDDTDGKTAETGLTISQADVRLSKNGADIAQKNESTSCTHDELGIYACPLDATDTGTCGRLQLWVHESGALPVWHDFTVIPANVYDSLIAGTDYLDTATAEITDAAIKSTTFASAAITADAIAADAIGASELAADAVAEIADQVWDELRAGHVAAGSFGQGVASVQGNVTGSVASVTAAVTIEDAAIKSNTFDTAAITAAAIAADAIGASELAADALAEIADQVWDEALAGHTGAGSAGAALTAATAPTAAAVADAVWDEAIADHLTSGTTGNKLNAAAAAAGAGAITFTYTLTNAVGGAPIADADVWVSSDLAGTNIIASGKTNASGEVTFYLDAGTVYVWRQKTGWNFTNPDTEVVA